MLVDLSMPLSPKTVPVPGHPEPTFTPLHLLERDGVRNTVMSLSLHTATHIDAPSHFDLPAGGSEGFNGGDVGRLLVVADEQ